MDKMENILINSLDIILKRHEILANNIANIETPGYIKKDINFEEELKKLLENEKIRIEPTVKELPEDKIKLEKEIIEVSKNNLLFNSFIKILILRHKILESSINTGGI